MDGHDKVAESQPTHSEHREHLAHEAFSHTNNAGAKHPSDLEKYVGADIRVTPDEGKSQPFLHLPQLNELMTKMAPGEWGTIVQAADEGRMKTITTFEPPAVMQAVDDPKLGRVFVASETTLGHHTSTTMIMRSSSEVLGVCTQFAGASGSRSGGFVSSFNASWSGPTWTKDSRDSSLHCGVEDPKDAVAQYLKAKELGSVTR